MCEGLLYKSNDETVRRKNPLPKKYQRGVKKSVILETNFRESKQLSSPKITQHNQNRETILGEPPSKKH